MPALILFSVMALAGCYLVKETSKFISKHWNIAQAQEAERKALHTGLPAESLEKIRQANQWKVVSTVGAITFTTAMAFIISPIIAIVPAAIAFRALKRTFATADAEIADAEKK